jgi:hypothetical protein
MDKYRSRQSAYLEFSCCTILFAAEEKSADVGLHRSSCYQHVVLEAPSEGIQMYRPSLHERPTRPDWYSLIVGCRASSAPPRLIHRAPASFSRISDRIRISQEPSPFAPTFSARRLPTVSLDVYWLNVGTRFRNGQLRGNETTTAVEIGQRMGQVERGKCPSNRGLNDAKIVSFEEPKNWLVPIACRTKQSASASNGNPWPCHHT